MCPKQEGQGPLVQVEIAHATLKGGTFATTVSSCVSNRLARANAHAELARACVLNLPTRCYDTIANTVNSCVSNWLAHPNKCPRCVGDGVIPARGQVQHAGSR